MRLYTEFNEAISEITRDLAEMGVRVHPKTYQDKDVENDPGFETQELRNYLYSILIPDSKKLKPTQPWADLEFNERISPNPINPGEAWKERADIWSDFLQSDGTFAYTYGERINNYKQIELIVKRIKEDPDSRQLYLSIYTPEDITKMGGVSRVPCSLGYYFQIRENHLDMTYLQRSADFVTHFQNDVYLAVKLLEYMSERTGYPVGSFTHWIGSLHVFFKDIREVF